MDLKNISNLINQKKFKEAKTKLLNIIEEKDKVFNKNPNL